MLALAAAAQVRSWACWWEGVGGRRRKVLCCIGGWGRSCAYPEPEDPLVQQVPELAGRSPLAGPLWVAGTSTSLGRLCL